jgi:serine/threonine protein kinase
MTVKDAKPGRYKPKCAKCGKRFGLTIASDAGQPPLVEALADDSHAATVAEAPPRPAPAPAAAKTQVGSSDATLPPDPQATGAWTAPAVTANATTHQRAVEATLPTGAAQATRPEASATTRPAGNIPAQIGGYKILRELGRGAMGAVYLAKQLSLDREVAIKTIQAQWADNPTFIARFTREAYAAAQLTHHNVVQIYDLGEENGTHYFSMEFVRGTSLDQIVKQAGKLDVEAAVGYVLQAARGLEFAHNHGMVHRDVKPANLMLSEQGVVKVADLGLVKTPQLLDEEALIEDTAATNAAARPPKPSGGTSLAAATADVTLANKAMGTPAYMAPEQSENAAGVDHRADIYSLGCTLYVLLTGRPPFEGATALEVMSKHKSEPVVRPEAIVKRVPTELSEITLKMVAKRPEDRYQTLGQVIKALENFLGIQSSAVFSPREEHAQTLDDCLAKFNAAGMAKLRGPLVMAFFALVTLLSCGGLVFSWAFLAGSLAMGAATIVTYFLASGLRERTFLFGKFRELLWTARWTDWLTWIVSGILLLVILLVLGWLWMAIGMAIFGVLVGLAYHFVIDGRAAAQRREALEKMEQLLKSLRLKGVDETALQQFVAKYSGQHWEEFFEALFGYEAKLAARRQWGKSDKGAARPRFRAWRDPLVRWIDGRVQAVRELRDRKHLQQVEEKNLQAQGLDLITARRRAHSMADALLDEAADARATVAAAAAAPVAASPTVVDPKFEAAKKRQRIKTMLADAKKGAYQAKRRRLIGTALSPFTFALGGGVRFLLGCLLLAGCGMWARQNGPWTLDKVLQSGTAATTSVPQDNAANPSGEANESNSQLKPLPIPLVGQYLSSFNAGIAGLVLIFLGLFRGWKMSLFAYPAAAIMLLGPSLGLPALLPFESFHATSLAAGLVIAFLGLAFGRTYED